MPRIEFCDVYLKILHFKQQITIISVYLLGVPVDSEPIGKLVKRRKRGKKAAKAARLW